MTSDHPGDGPAAPERSPAPAAKDPRADRLAAALRENLKRRKAQARGRAAAEADAPAAASDPARPDAGDER